MQHLVSSVSLGNLQDGIKKKIEKVAFLVVLIFGTPKSCL